MKRYLAMLTLAVIPFVTACDPAVKTTPPVNRESAQDEYLRSAAVLFPYDSRSDSLAMGEILCEMIDDNNGSKHGFAKDLADLDNNGSIEDIADRLVILVDVAARTLCPEWESTVKAWKN